MQSKIQILIVILFTLGFSSIMLSAEKNKVATNQKSNSPAGNAVNRKKAPKKKQPPFQWVNSLGNRKHTGLSHQTFQSTSMKKPVGFCIYLPEEYHKPKHSKKRFPVVYYLHGGRPGNETKSVGLVPFIHKAISSGKVTPMIYVFVNGGAVSHYNTPDKNSMGEDVFIQELIPHIDRTYRTIAHRNGRGIEGFSQGGRGTTRIMFKHPHLFVSAAPGGAGYATEKRISENDGRESEFLTFAKGDNTWDLAKEYAGRMSAMKQTLSLSILIHVGTKGFNYQNNLEYMTYLDSLKIPYEKLIVKDAPHSAKIIYEKNGLDLMTFHARNFQHVLKDRHSN